jgi:glycine hydroxymethyltransferase
MRKDGLMGAFIFEPSPAAPVGSVLYNAHLKLVSQARLADFAGYLMPLWYSSITAEHRAVRRRAGIFDCTHMGIFEVAGKDAVGFLNTLTTNQITNLRKGYAQYSYILDAAGNVLDDIIVYRRGASKFMVVVNAANEPKIKAYFEALLQGQAPIDADHPSRTLKYKPKIRDMRDAATGTDCRVDIAVQGPASLGIIRSATADATVHKRIERLKPFRFIEASLDGIDCIISRTGYTGAETGYELYVHPQRAAALWNLLLKNAELFGGVPCGLGARDSLRIEAGLPLYGHELNGDLNISPFEAGYCWAVKLGKEFFVGKAAMQQRAKEYNMKVVRLELPGEKGVRPVRRKDCVLNTAGKCVGQILSCANTGEKQYALAYAVRQSLSENDAAGIYYLARNDRQAEEGRKKAVRKGQVLQADIKGTVLCRFAKF